MECILSVLSKLNYLFIYFSLDGILAFFPCDVYMGKLPCTLTCMLLLLIGCKKHKCQSFKLQTTLLLSIYGNILR